MPDTSIFPALSDFHPLPGSLIAPTSNGLDTQPSVTTATPDFEDFFENGAIALHLVGPDGVILKANRAELELLGYRPDEYIGRHIAEFHTDKDIIEHILGRLARGEKLNKYPARLLAKDGSIKHVEMTSSVNFRDGKFVNTRCFSVDVTELVCARADVRRKEEQLRQVLDALPAAIYTTDPDGCLTYYNRAAAEIAGREPEIGKDKWCVTFRIHTPDGKVLPHDQCPMAIALKEKRPVRGVEAMAQRPDGTLFPFLPFPTPIHDENGRLVGAVNMLVDISERKQSETQQKILLDELNHRVKNNMQMLCGLLESAQREACPEARTVLRDARRRVAAMAAAQQVLYNSAAPTRFNASEFLHAVGKSAQQAFDKDITLKVEEATGYLPNDVSMPLALILNELLTNAAKYGANGRREGTIILGLREINQEMVLWVEDDGPGYDYKPNGRRASGLGLVGGLVHHLRGTFEVERGIGARCIVRFPLRR
jgi:PAS domain S-box-containing protein